MEPMRCSSKCWTELGSMGVWHANKPMHLRTCTTLGQYGKVCDMHGLITTDASMHLP